MAVVNPFVDRVLEVVTVLAEDGQSLRLGEISTRLGLSKSVTHRMLSSLCAAGWVAQDEPTGFYRLTMRLPLLGQRFLAASGITDVTKPVLQALARESGELALLTAVDGERLSWIGSEQGATSGLIFKGGSRTLPLHASANAKVWLATLPVERAVAIVLERGFGTEKENGPNAVRTVEGLLATLAETRKRGWGINLEETEIGVVTVARAIHDRGASSPVVGTVSVCGPSVRFGRKEAERLAKGPLAGAAKELTELWPLRTSRSDLPAAVAI